MGPGTAIIACLLTSTGCPAPQPPPPPIPISRFAATYERSGGLKPMPQKLVIRPGRRATATWTKNGVNEVESAATRFTLPVRKVRQFRVALSQPQFSEYESPLPGNCADCYLYSIEFRGHTITFSQAEIPVWIRKTVGRFEALIEAHLPFH